MSMWAKGGMGDNLLMFLRLRQKRGERFHPFSWSCTGIFKGERRNQISNGRVCFAWPHCISADIMVIKWKVRGMGWTGNLNVFVCCKMHYEALGHGFGLSLHLSHGTFYMDYNTSQNVRSITVYRVIDYKCTLSSCKYVSLPVNTTH